MIAVHFHFYKLSDFPRTSWHSRLRGWATTFFSEYVHCNYQIGGIVYNLSTNGYEIWKDEYGLKPSSTVIIKVAEANVDAFIHRFSGLYVRPAPAALWAIFGLASLPVLCRYLDNCSSFPRELVGGRERLPDRLYQRLTKEKCGVMQ